ncbi:MAG: hypothetical protein ACWIPH_04610 [Ostreibacterium sp.]
MYKKLKLIKKFLIPILFITTITSSFADRPTNKTFRLYLNEYSSIVATTSNYANRKNEVYTKSHSFPALSNNFSYNINNKTLYSEKDGYKRCVVNDINRKPNNSRNGFVVDHSCDGTHSKEKFRIMTIKWDNSEQIVQIVNNVGGDYCLGFFNKGYKAALHYENGSLGEFPYEQVFLRACNTPNFNTKFVLEHRHAFIDGKGGLGFSLYEKIPLYSGYSD